MGSNLNWDTKMRKIACLKYEMELERRIADNEWCTMLSVFELNKKVIRYDGDIYIKAMD